MTNREIKIAYQEFDSLNELSHEDLLLAKAAIDATSRSYAPYSNFNVGAAIMYEDGEIIQGSNQENAAYPSGLCAERTALFYASSSRPDAAIKALAIAAGQNGKLCETPATPCGACRQVMAQYQTKGGRPMAVILVGADKIWKFEKVDDLLPLVFDSI
jgi:cytidine deaminase